VNVAEKKWAAFYSSRNGWYGVSNDDPNDRWMVGLSTQEAASRIADVLNEREALRSALDAAVKRADDAEKCLHDVGECCDACGEQGNRQIVVLYDLRVRADRAEKALRWLRDESKARYDRRVPGLDSANVFTVASMALEGDEPDVALAPKATEGDAKLPTVADVAGFVPVYCYLPRGGKVVLQASREYLLTIAPEEPRETTMELFVYDDVARAVVKEG
jgi:hypothetical protein